MTCILPLTCAIGMSTAHHVLSCSFAQWYPVFKSVSFRSQVVTLPKKFVDYLVQDGVYLPDNNSAVRLSPDALAVSSVIATSQSLFACIAVAQTFCP